MNTTSGSASTAGLPNIGARVPALVVRVVFALLAAGLCLAAYGHGFRFAVGLVLTGYTVAVPRRLGAWLLIVFLAASQLTRDPVLDWQFCTLLAGLHLLHVLATLVLPLPYRSRIQLAALRRPLLRLLAIQIPSQLVAVLVLATLAPNSHGQTALTLPVVGVVGAAALLALTLLLAVPLLHHNAR